MLDDDLVVPCDENLDMSEAVSINPNGKTNHWLIAVVLLAIACLLLLVVIVVNYWRKRGLTTPCLLSY